MYENIHDEILSRLENTDYLEPCSKEEIRIALDLPYDDSRAQGTIALVRKIWTSFPGLGVCPVLEQVYQEEGDHNFYERYRDHIVHTLEVYLLGLDMLNSLPKLKERIFPGLNQMEIKKRWAATALAHDQGYIMEINDRLGIPPKVQKILSNPIMDIEFLHKNTKTVLGSYIQIPIWPSNNIMDLITIFLEDKKVNILEKISELLPQNLLGKGKNDLATYFDVKKMTEYEVWDHGITSMLLLQQFYLRLKTQLTSLIKNLDKIDDILEEREKQAIMYLKNDLDNSNDTINEASKAIALHNIKKNFSGEDEETYANRKQLRLENYQLSLQTTPLAWFLVFCDILQEWNRPLAKKATEAGKNIQSPNELSIEYDREKEIIFLSFKNEKKMLKLKGESLFWKKRLDLIIVLNETDVDRYFAKGPKNELGLLIKENEELKEERDALKAPKPKGEKQQGENWRYMGVIDSNYPTDKLDKDVKMAYWKYKEFEPIFVLYTGGTVGMVRDNPRDPKSPIKTKSLEFVLPNLKRIEEIKNDIHFWELKPPLDSSNIGANEWIEITKIIQKVYPYYQGFVILHGTDTMAYTASALSFILRNLSKPVILTGAEKPISEPVSDAESNIVNSILIAAYKAMDKPCVPEVCIFFGSKLLRGNRTKKIHSLALQGFDSPNCEPLGTVEDDIDINQKILLDSGKGSSLNIDDNLYPGVAIFEVYPNNDACIESLNFILGQEHIRGLILKTYGTGNAPTAPEKYLDIIRKAVLNGKIIVNLTHCPKGQVQVRLFETNARLFEYGVINGGDLTVEAALCKLMWLLGKQSKNLDQTEIETIKAQMQINFAGELRYSAYNLRNSNLKIMYNEPYRGKPQPLQLFDYTAINHAYIRAQGIKIEGPSCIFELKFYYCFPRIEQKPTDPRQELHCIDSVTRTWEGQEDGITFNLDATAIVKKIRERERDRFHSLGIVANCDHNITIKTLELAIFTENIKGVRDV